MLGQVEADRMYFLAKPGIFLAISTAVQVWSSKPVFIKSGIYIYMYIYIYATREIVKLTRSQYLQRFQTFISWLQS